MGKRKRPSPAWVQRLTYLSIRSALGAMLTGEIGPNVRGAAALGRAFGGARINRKRLARAADNLAVAFPDWDLDRREEYALRAYEHLFQLAVEMAYTPRLLTEDGWADHLRLGDLMPAVRRILPGSGPERRPCVLITGHCGNWELLGYALALLGFPMYALYRPLDLAPMDLWVRRQREKRGLVLLDKFGAVEELPRVMAQGASVGFVADQNAGDRGLFVPFFGRLASTYKTIGLLALHHNAPVVTGLARRLVWSRDGGAESEGGVGFQDWSGEPFRYRLDVIDAIDPQDWADQPDPLFYITARYRRSIEMSVRRAPEQYLWMHRYWKSRPRHERLGRALPGALRAKLEALPWMTPEELERIEEWSRRDAAALAAAGEGAASPG